MSCSSAWNALPSTPLSLKGLLSLLTGHLVEVISSPHLPHLQHLSQFTITGLSAFCISGP